MNSLNDVLKYEPVRRFLERSSLAVALAECDPFQDAVPCWQAVMSATPSPALGRLESVMDNGQIINCSRTNNRKQMK